MLARSAHRTLLSMKVRHLPSARSIRYWAPTVPCM